MSAMDVIDVGHDTYVVKFTNLDEYERALFGGPWDIADHYLVVTRCYPNFDPETFTILKLAVWVCFPNLPMEYYDQEFLLKIGCRIGNPLRVDTITIAAVRGHFARLCVEIDLEKPFLSKFRLRRKVRRIEYEAMHVICFECGRYGHRKEECKKDNSNSIECLEMQEIQASGRHHIPDIEVTEAYGSWMLVRKQMRKKRKAMDKCMNGETKISNDGQGSRFLVLNELFEDFREENQELTLNPKEGIGRRKFIGSTSGDKSKDSTCHTRDKVEQSAKGMRSRVAASMDYHVLVRGSNKENTITRTIVPGPLGLDHDGMDHNVGKNNLPNFNNLDIPHPSAPHNRDCMVTSLSSGDESDGEPLDDEVEPIICQSESMPSRVVETPQPL
ncbi:hypothetical protein DITRI_Ditri17bG0081800 [Diplodiscus trichospermus]